MIKLKHGLLVKPIAFGALVMGACAHGAWVVQPSAQVEASHEDNIRLDEAEQEGIATTAVMQARVANVTERSSISLVGNLLYRMYGNVDDVPGRDDPDDRDEQSLSVVAQTSVERTVFGLRSVMRRDVLLRRTDFIPDNFDGLIPDDDVLDNVDDIANDAGITDTNVTREEVRRSFISFDPYVGYELNERTNVRLGYQFVGLRYDSTGEQAGLQDSDTHSIYGSLNRSLTERDRISLNARTSNFEPDQSLETDTYEVTLGWNRRVSDRFRFGLQAGARRLESDITEDDGLVFRANARYTTEQGQLSASISRIITSTAFGDVAESDRVRMSYRHRVSDRLSFRISANAFQTERDSGTSNNDRSSLTVEPSVNWKFSESISGGLSYRYRWLDRESDPDSVSGNSFALSIAYQPPSRL